MADDADGNADADANVDEEVKDESKSDSSTDIYFFRRMPRHIFSEPGSLCECLEEHSSCKCLVDIPVLDQAKPQEVLSVCECLMGPSASLVIPRRKLRILTTVARTEEYLTKRRIPQLLRWLFTKVVSETPKRPVMYLEKLLNALMMFRAGVYVPPVIYEERHLKAMIKSFDPGNRGWLSAGQVKRLYATLGIEINPPKDLEDQVATDVLLKQLKQTQCEELLALVSAGIEKPEPLVPPTPSSTNKTINYDDIFSGLMSVPVNRDVTIPKNEK